MSSAFAIVDGSVGWKRIGQKVTIDSNPFARLKYYLSCVKTCIPGLSDLPEQLTDHTKYRNLSVNEMLAIVALVGVYDIKTMIRAGIFVPDFDSVICKDFSNDFLEITDRRVTAVAVGSVILAGRQVKVSKKMLFTENWVKNNFLTPISEALTKLQVAKALR
jgi:hypothetical protein